MTLAFVRLDPRTGYKTCGARAKTMLLGHKLSGGIVRLAETVEAGGRIGVAEGIETALSIMASGHGPVWATLGSNNLAKFPVLREFEEIVIWADNGFAGERAAEVLAERWHVAGKSARIILPPEQHGDWNDVIRNASQEMWR
ncbi:MAG: toprim domain-containing protein [Nitratireductor sp.]|uniref:toprim domain-containing protein n=1 Tax=Nitratireductor sp. TaxID=1872084 RepID=UPI00260CDE5E|nr:toprim domain-containing protein [Nitratireductor sp.]MCV0352560.1 toprim domain-containing protein [Nitratireductor sp.]